MINADRWVKDHEYSGGEDLETGDLLPYEVTSDDVRAIQLDAYKAGMTRAAEVADRYKSQDDYTRVDEVHKAILTERDKLKEIPQ